MWISFRSFKNFNVETFNQELSLAPWHVGEIFEDVEDQLFYWNTLTKTIVDQHTPVKTMRVRDHDVPVHDNKMEKCYTCETKSWDKVPTKQNSCELWAKTDMQKRSYEAKKISNQRVLEDKIGRSEKKPSRSHQIYVTGKDMCTIVAKLQESATLATN